MNEELEILGQGVIIGSGSNANGTYTKWSNGRMECEKQVPLSAVPCNVSEGSLFRSADVYIGNWSQSFIVMPTIATQIISDSVAFVLRIRATTASDGGLFMIGRPTTSAGVNGILTVKATGRWKE